MAQALLYYNGASLKERMVIHWRGRFLVIMIMMCVLEFGDRREKVYRGMRDTKRNESVLYVCITCRKLNYKYIIKD